MTILSLIAIVDENHGLGKENHLLCHFPADLKHFKTLTLGKPIIMGRKTYDSIGKVLPGRLNIVLSRQAINIEGATVLSTLEEALAYTKAFPEVMIIGGAQLFEQTLPMAARVYLTRIHHCFDADVFFPPLDPAMWSCDEATWRERDAANPYDLTFCRFQQKGICITG